MKKRKIKLFASLTSLVMVVAVMAVGIWAATNATLSVTNTVDFAAAKNVKATISYSTTKDNITDGSYTAEALTQHAKLLGNDVETEGSYTIPPLALGDLTFVAEDVTEETMTYSYTIVFHNNAVTTDENDQLIVTVTPPTLQAEMTATKRYVVEVIAPNFTANTATIAATEEASYTVKITIDTGFSIAGTVDLGCSFALSVDNSRLVS